MRRRIITNSKKFKACWCINVIPTVIFRASLEWNVGLTMKGDTHHVNSFFRVDLCSTVSIQRIKVSKNEAEAEEMLKD